MTKAPGSQQPGAFKEDAVTEQFLTQDADSAKPPAPDQNWRTKLLFDVRGTVKRILPNHANLVTILTNDQNWLGVLGFNEFAQRVETLRTPPWYGQEAASTGVKPGPWADEDDTRLLAWLERAYGLSYRIDAITRAVMVAARNQSNFHPVRKYLESLHWDGKDRLPTLFSRYFGAAQSPYLALVGVWWPVSAVARAMKPGCKVDTVLILEGEQGARKSLALAVLATCPEWAMDTALPIGDKDAVAMMSGKWIVEFAELASWHGRRAELVKAFLTSQNDHYRPPYGRRAVDVPRSCVFAASTNEKAYLLDPTGARRFWPVACGRIDPKALKTDRDQLWAEALVRYRRKEIWWPDGEQEELCRAEQDARRVADPWEATVRRWLLGREPYGGAARDKNERLTGNCVLRQAIDLHPAKIGKSEEMRIGAVLTTLGWHRKKMRIDGESVWGYQRPQAEDGGTP